MKEQEYTNMLNKSSQPTWHKNKINSKNNKNNIGIIYDILNIISFSSLFILSWFSLKWLHLYQYIFTIHRYINYGFSIYFPIQVSSLFLYIIDIIIVLIITLSYIYFIIIFIIKILKKDSTEENNEYEFDIINKKLSKITFVPIIINSILFLIGKIIYKNYKISQYFFYMGLVLGLASLFILLKINLEEKFVNNSQVSTGNYEINNEINILYIIFKEYFFQILLCLDLYYCFYVICQIISYLINSYEIQNFLGIIANLSLGIISLYINYKLKSIGNSFFFSILYSGILYFQFTIRPQEREEIKLGYGEAVLSGIFFIFSFIEFFYNIAYKYTSDN